MRVKILQVPKALNIDFDFTVKETREIAMDARSLILKRTQAGRDINDRKFKAYSFLNPKSGTPNLTGKGSMLRGMSIKGRKNSSSIYFGRSQQNDKAYWHQYGTDPYTIKPKNKKALRFATSQPNKGTRKNPKGKWLSAGHEMPGLPQREFFGLSPKDINKLTDKTIEPIFARRFK
jgi:hypothetical protein